MVPQQLRAPSASRWRAQAARPDHQTGLEGLWAAPLIQGHIFYSLNCRTVLLSFLSALGRTDSNLRPSLFVVILLHGHGRTRRDKERQNGASIGGSALLDGQGGTGRDTRLRSDCGQDLQLNRGT